MRGGLLMSMFGELGPRLKGGVNFLLGAFVGTTVTVKVPMGNDLTIQAGDAPMLNTSGGTGTGRTLTLQGGTAGGAANGGNGGPLVIKGGDAIGSSNGNGGNVSITGGGAFTTNTAGNVTISGGPPLS